MQMSIFEEIANKKKEDKAKKAEQKITKKVAVPKK